MLYVFTCNDTGSFGIFSLDQVIVACTEAKLLRVSVLGIDYLNNPELIEKLASAEMVCTAAKASRPDLSEESFFSFKRLVDSILLSPASQGTLASAVPLMARGPGAVVAVQLEDSRGEDAH